MSSFQKNPAGCSNVFNNPADCSNVINNPAESRAGGGHVRLISPSVVIVYLLVPRALLVTGIELFHVPVSPSHSSCLTLLINLLKSLSVPSLSSV